MGINVLILMLIVTDILLIQMLISLRSLSYIPSQSILNQTYLCCTDSFCPSNFEYHLTTGVQSLSHVQLFCDPNHGLQPSRLLCPWYFPGKNTGVDCHSLFQGIFQAQGLNMSLLLARQIVYYCTTWEALKNKLNYALQKTKLRKVQRKKNYNLSALITFNILVFFFKMVFYTDMVIGYNKIP